MIVRQLPRGIPDGYRPQKQDARTDAYLMVSDYTRRIAHELDDLHRAWVGRHKHDDLAHLDNSPFANDNMPLNHLDWLVEYEKADDRYQEVVKRRLWIQNELGNAKRSRKFDGKFWHKNQFLTHYEALKLELMYCSVLQSRLWGMVRAEHRVGQQNNKRTIRELSEKLKEVKRDDLILVSLINLRSALLDWFNDKGDLDLSDELRQAMKDAKYVIQVESENLADEKPITDSERLVILDGFFVRESELMDAKLKGNALNEATWITEPQS